MLFRYDALWQSQAVANTVPADIFAVVPPAGGWTGPTNAPFGTVGAGFVTNLQVGTTWAVDTGLWLRRALTVDGLAPVRLRAQVGNACYAYLDGELVGTFNPTNAAGAVSTCEIIIPQELLPAGVHQLAVLCLDEAGGTDGTTWFWMDADYLPVVQSLWPGRGVGESISWLTDVTIYEDGAEDREQLRGAPRHQFRMECFVPAAFEAMVRNQLFGARVQQWVLPLWPQIQHVGAVVAGELTLDLLTSFSEYRAGGRLIIWQSPTVWQVVGIDQVVDANSVSLTSPTQAFTDAWVAPAREAHFEGDPGRAFNGRTSSVSYSFGVEDNRALVVAAPPQYLGSDIYFDPGLLNGDNSSEAVTTQLQMVDEALGLVAYTTPWLHNRPSRSHRMMGEGAEEAWAIRQWLHRRAGRLNAFWQPSFEIDLRVQSVGAVTTNLVVAADEYLRHAAARDHLAIETTTGWVARAVFATTNLGGGQIQLTLDTALGVDASAILRVCFLGLRRLNADRVEVGWPGGTVCTCNVPVIDIAP